MIKIQSLFKKMIKIQEFDPQIGNLVLDRIQSSIIDKVATTIEKLNMKNSLQKKTE